MIFILKAQSVLPLRNSKLSVLQWIQTCYGQFGFLCRNFSLQENDG